MSRTDFAIANLDRIRTALDYGLPNGTKEHA